MGPGPAPGIVRLGRHSLYCRYGVERFGEPAGGSVAAGLGGSQYSVFGKFRGPVPALLLRPDTLHDIDGVPAAPVAVSMVPKFGPGQFPGPGHSKQNLAPQWIQSGRRLALFAVHPQGSALLDGGVGGSPGGSLGGYRFLFPGFPAGLCQSPSGGGRVPLDKREPARSHGHPQR